VTRTPQQAKRRKGSDPSPIDIGSRRELFVDDCLIDRLTGKAELRMHHPRAAEIAIVHDAPWEGSSSGYHTVFQDGNLYRMYYRGLHVDVSQGRLDSDRHRPFCCYAESEDGIHWRKPELDIVEFDGSKKNNIILDGVGTHNLTPFRDANPECVPEARYKAMGGLKEEGGLFAFKSPDGIHWSLMADEPVITEGAFDSQNLAFWDPTLGEYRAYWRFFTEGVTEAEDWQPSGYRAVRTATSENFLKWGRHTDLTYVDSPHEHLYTNQVKPYHRAPHILIGFPTRYTDPGWCDSVRALPELENRELRASATRRFGTALTEGLLMASRDGVRFKRWNEAFLRPGIQRPGTWFYGQQYIAWHAVETHSAIEGAPNELSLYASEGHPTGISVGIRRYVLRLDGFVSVWASFRGGELFTKPLTFSGARLALNFSTSAAGSLRVELQEPDGKSIPGFTLADCQEMLGDELDRTVNWQEGCDLSELIGQPVCLRFALRDADLYSFQFVRRDPPRPSEDHP
jgi:hypothetical protein